MEADLRRVAANARASTSALSCNGPTEPLWAFSLFKNTAIGGGNTLQIRIETFNVFNVRIYGGPNTDPRSANFGIVDTASQVNFPRTIQLGASLRF